tara:strand:- start:49 stop:327 length:279 start_codon:yes stop_codon:yes gene_type:complete
MKMTNKEIMKTMYKMLPATNKLEAIKSILDAMTENPLWLLECSSKEFATVYRLHNTEKRKQYLNLMSFYEVRELYIELRTHYYNSVAVDKIF